MPAPQDLIYDVSLLERKIHRFMVKHCEPLSQGGAILYAATESLRESERILRTMYVPDYSGL